MSDSNVIDLAGRRKSGNDAISTLEDALRWAKANDAIAVSVVLENMTETIRLSSDNADSRSLLGEAFIACLEIAVSAHNSEDDIPAPPKDS